MVLVPRNSSWNKTNSGIPSPASLSSDRPRTSAVHLAPSILAPDPRTTPVSSVRAPQNAASDYP